jgi:hypothetical protein
VRGAPSPAATPKSNVFPATIAAPHRGLPGDRRYPTSENRRRRSSRYDDFRRQRQLCSADHRTSRKRTTRLGYAAPRDRSVMTRRNERCYLVPQRPLCPHRSGGTADMRSETNGKQIASHQVPATRRSWLPGTQRTVTREQVASRRAGSGGDDIVRHPKVTCAVARPLPKEEVHRVTISCSEERKTECSRRDAASKLGKLDFRASLPSRIRTLVSTVRRHQGRCSLGLPPLQGFPPQRRETVFTSSPFTSLATCPTRRSCALLPHKGHQRWGWLVSFETAAPLEVSHLVA